MSVFHKTMVWLGLVDDDEYYGEDDEYYADEYGEPIAAPPRQAARQPAGSRRYGHRRAGRRIEPAHGDP